VQFAEVARSKTVADRQDAAGCACDLETGRWVGRDDMICVTGSLLFWWVRPEAPCRPWRRSAGNRGLRKAHTLAKATKQKF